MFFFVESGKIQGPIYQPDKAPENTTNKDFLRQFVANLLQNAFPNLQAAQINNFVSGLFTYNNDIQKFKLHLRDFLVQLKEFAEDNAELFAEEREKAQQEAKDAEREKALKVGGLLKPADLDQDDEL
ncbi:MAG: Karyopherin transporter [Sclerophora amabilis]|nr:MAG: Karyopherin transporter [Sclerophora amabilis]